MIKPRFAWNRTSGRCQAIITSKTGSNSYKILKELERCQTRNECQEQFNTYLKTLEPRLECADCFDVFPSIETGSVNLVLADLPYGTTHCEWDSVLPLDKLWAEYKRILKSNGIVALTATQPFAWRLCASNPDWFKYEIIWEKPNGTNPLLVKVQPFRVHENVLIFYNGGKTTYNPQMTYGHRTYTGFKDESKTIGEAFTGRGDNKRGLKSRHRENTDGSRYPRSVQFFKQERGNHPTKKPVDLMAWLIRTYTNPGDLVLDNTMGEGTTGIACVREARRFIGIEINSSYFTTAKNDINNEVKRCRSI